MRRKEGYLTVTLLSVLILIIVPSFLIGDNKNSSYEMLRQSITSFEAVKDTGNYDFEDIKDNDALEYTPFVESRLPYSYSDSDTWIRMKITTDNLDLNKNKYIIVFLNPNIDYIDAYIPEKTGHIVSYQKFEKGLMRALTDQEINNNKWNFIIPENIDANSYIYFKVKSNIDIEITIENYVDSLNTAINSNLGFGIFFGLLICIILYNIYIYIYLKKQYYIYYILYIFSMLLYQMRINCFFINFLSISYSIYMRLLWVFVLSFFLFAMLFAINFLETKKYCRNIDIIIKISFSLAVIVSFIGIIGFYKQADKLMHYIQMICPITVIIAAFKRCRQGFRPAIYFLHGWVILALSSIVWSLSVYMPFYIPSTYILQSGVVAEAILLSLSIVDKISKIVSEKEIIKKNEAKYKELSRKDTLTSLYNKRYLIERIKYEIHSSIKHNRTFSIIIMDIDNFKNFNDKLGHIEGDRILINITEKIYSHLRNGDIACRYGGDEIVIILPNTTEEEAFLIAERIRNKITSSAYFSNDKKIRVSVSLGVAQYKSDENYEDLLVRCDNNLYSAKDKGKNCTVV